MSNESIIKGAMVGAGGVLLGMYLYNRRKTLLAGITSKGGEGSGFSDLSSEKLAELKDNIEDILAEREVKSE